MTRKTIAIITFTIVALAAGLFGAAYYISRDTGKTTVETLRDFLPFGAPPQDVSFGRPLGRAEEGTVADETALGDGEVPELRQLTRAPIAGATTVTRNKALYARYVDRASGNVFDVNLETNERVRVTNTTLPGIYETVWQSGGARFVARYLDANDVIKSFSAQIVAAEPAAQQLGKLDGVFLADGITSLAAQPDADALFSVTEFGISALGTVTRFDGARPRQVFDMPVREWTTQWVNKDAVALTTKAASGFRGILYFLNPQTGRTEKILGPVSGLLTLSAPKGDAVLYSSSAGRTLETFLFRRKEATSEPFPVITLPEKCVWRGGNSSTLLCGAPGVVPDGAFPDEWYQGAMFFDDVIWKIDAETGEAALLAVPREFGGATVDVTNPFLDPDGTYFFFTNKRDGTLWSLKIPER